MSIDPITPSSVHIIAHSKEVQDISDKIALSFSVQYELARGVSHGRWSWADVLQSDLRLLSGPNRSAANLDREEAALTEGRSRGLGLMGEWQEKADWYGGQVQLVARLEEVQGSFRLVLAKMEMRKSHRFGRYLASWRLLQVSVPQIIVSNRKEDLDAFFKQRFVLNGRVYVLCGSKDNKVFLLSIPEDYERSPRCVPTDARRVSLEDFVNWHNPLQLNGRQPVAKYVTRFDLGFSISVPVISILPGNTFYKDDEYAPHDPNKKPPAECIYTDGCGYMNGAALSAIARRMNLETRPTAVQGRIAGAKGLWVLHPRDQAPTGTPKIWIRNSQVKIQLDHKQPHPAHQIFDLLAPPRVTVPSRLSRLTILNLAHNGVSVATFVELMRDTLDAEMKLLTDWSGPKAMLLLWRAVERVGGVAMKRIMQHAQGATRAMGLTGRIREDDGAEVDNELEDPRLKSLLEQLESLDETELLSVNTFRDQFTGEPLGPHAVALDLIQAGFFPQKLKLLYDKIKWIVTKAIDDIIHEYHISVPLSAEAFIVPDPYGVLEEGEIHFKSSKPLKDSIGYEYPNILLGEVLIYRNPCRLPSDVRKVTAVRHAALAEYVDVIVLPKKGPRSLASILAGGDVCVCIYDPRLVESFQNSEISEAPDNFLKDNFEDQGKIQQVSEMADELGRLASDPDARRSKLQDCLLLGLANPPIGPYSKFHENAVYTHGYDAPESIRMAFMFNTVLDSRKTGYRVKPEVYKNDKMLYDKEQPDCLKSSKDVEIMRQGNVAELRRSHSAGQFILDALRKEGRRMRDEQIKRYDSLGSTLHNWSDVKDPDLVRPFDRARRHLDAPAFRHDFERIKAHIEEHIGKWQKVTSESRRTPPTPSKRENAKAASKNLKKQRREKWDTLVREFAAGPVLAEGSPLADIGDIELLKASWAYDMKPNFAWKVAFQALCRIKASTRAPVAFTGEFADAMSIPGSAGRVLEQCRLTAQGAAT
ncbi:RNA dependent RNA polymerase-domain-containing protein [Daedaleopsis nitida]|nr:RNA dependent RNA polymerase-domain-containing protein [Daedaleopsis nitida]